ncbi:MAG: competence/damage-inducible protein A [Clostridia bacterium]|nr:competence/damage-inducible protein A [Clostridia bacterium]
MKAEIIAVGTEILLGDIVNTDAQVISLGLNELGIDVYYQTAVGDNPERLKEVLEIARKRSDLIITTGGLGPTLDDLTRETIAEAFGKQLVLHKRSLRRITAFFDQIGREMTQNNVKQAMLPAGCKVLDNEWGTAPGCAFEADGVHVLMLPGPPRECTPLFHTAGMAYLAKLAGGVIVSRNIRIFGIGESTMEDKLHDLMEKSTNPTLAPYAKDGECLVRVTAKAENAEEAERLLQPAVKQVCDILGDVVYGVDVESLEHAVAKLLTAKGLALSVAESCTGGLLSKRITDVSGASQFYRGGACTYCNEIKMKVLGVKKETLDEFTAVSSQTAREMAEGIAKAYGTDLGIGITGYAGPDGGEDGTPAGTVYIGIYYQGKTNVRCILSPRGRERARWDAVNNALDMILRAVEGRKQLLSVERGKVV